MQVPYMDPLFFSHENMQIHEIVFGKILRSVSRRIRIASSTLKDFNVRTHHTQYPELLSTLINRLSSDGIHIQILTTPKMLDFRFARRLRPQVEIRGCARNHLKMILADSRILYVGSGNLTSSAVGLRSPNRRNFEIGVLTTNRISVKYASTIFNKIWTGHCCLGCKYLYKKSLGCTIPICAHIETAH